MKATVALVMALALASGARAAVKTEEATYRVDDASFKGLIAYDDAAKEKRPGVLVVHEWWGLNEYAKRRARELAALGYVALAVDMYGDGKTTTHPAEAGAMASKVAGDAEEAQVRFLAARALLARNPHVDATRIAAIGYCFGGSTVLKMALAGVDLKGVVSFHGALKPVTEGPAAAIKAKVLVCTGADDPMIPAEDVQAFEATLAKAHADWQVISYGGAKHSFTNKDAGAAGMEQLAYNAAADARSWAAMKSFFEEIFAAGR